MSIDLKQFHQAFYEESFEGLDIMESILVEMDLSQYDDEDVNTIFRAAHSIKGGSATFGFSIVADFTHVLETLLDEVRDGRRKLTPEAVELLLQSVDCLRELLYALKDEQEPDASRAQVLQQEFEAMLKGESEGTTEKSGENVNKAQGIENKASSVESNGECPSHQNQKGWKIHFKPAEDILRTGNEPLRMLRELESMGEMSVAVDLSSIPDFSVLHPDDCHLAWTITLITNAEKSVIDEVFEWVVDESDITITPLMNETVAEDVVGDEPGSLEQKQSAVAAQTDEKESVSKQPEGSAGNKASSEKPIRNAASGNKTSTDIGSIRVSTEKVDSLVNMVGELVITQSMLGQIGKDFDISKLPKLLEGLAQLDHNTRELQESVMRIRMLPISFAFSRFPRMVRDVAAKLGKQVEFKVSGEQTELDKTVMEKIGDPMVHLVRNAMDHGLETPEERVASGKDPMGTLCLNAYHQGGNICIEIIDDGRGLNTEKIRAKAIAQGLISETDNLSEAQVHDLIFQPGFSTADAVSDLSGRGVGMDVVRRNIHALNGSVEVVSEVGKGSTFTIRLPLTLAILDGQLIRVTDQTYVAPLVSIVESLQIEVANVSRIAGEMEVYRLRDEYIPIIKLYELFNIKPESEELENALMVVLESENDKIGLVVDELLAQQQVVIKSLESNYRRIDGISGATILGDGTVALILDITGLVKLAGISKTEIRKLNRELNDSSDARFQAA